MAAKKQITEATQAAPDVMELEIKINLDAMTFGDLEMALAAEEGGAAKIPVKELLPFLNRVVVGGVKGIPLTAMPQIMDALTKALEGMANPKN